MATKTGESESDKIHIQQTQKHMHWIDRFSYENISQRAFLKQRFLPLGTVIIEITDTLSVHIK